MKTIRILSAAELRWAIKPMDGKVRVHCTLHETEFVMITREFPVADWLAKDYLLRKRMVVEFQEKFEQLYSVLEKYFA